MPIKTLPNSTPPISAKTVQVVGGENLMRIAELYLGDAMQWWRIAELNAYPGETPDFIVSLADAQRLGGILQIPPVNPRAIWP